MRVEFFRETPQEPAPSVLRELSVGQRLMAAAVADPVLWEQLQASGGYDPSLWEVMEHFRDQFPPKEPIPTTVPSFPPELGAAIVRIAEGEPGDTVADGLLPSRVTVLARLLLARAEVYPAEVVLRAAEHGYDRGRGYPAHDAFACALVHPRIDAIGLVERYGLQPKEHRDQASLRMTDQLIAWARFHDYLPDPSACPCGHDKSSEPQTRRQIMALYARRRKIEDLLEPIELDRSRWLGVYACRLCGEIWAEDSITSGHADFFFYYPIETDDPKAWLSRAEPLQRRTRSW